MAPYFHQCHRCEQWVCGQESGGGKFCQHCGGQLAAAEAAGHR